MSIRIEIAKDKELWNDVLSKSPNGTIFHSWEWLTLVAKYARKKIANKVVAGRFYPLIAFDGDEPIGAFPVFKFRCFGITLLLSPPHGTENYYMGPIIVYNKNIKKSKFERRLLDFWKAIDEFLQDNFSPSYTLIHTSPGLVDTRFFKWRRYTVEPRYTYTIDLNVGVEELWGRLSKSMRREIRKSKTKFEIREGESKDVKEIYHRMKERGRIYCTLDYLKKVYEVFHPENLKIFVAEDRNNIVSGIINLVYRDKVLFWIGLPKVNSDVSPNGLLLWNSIEWAVNNSYSKYEIMSAEEPELFPFKSRFNAELELIFTARRYSKFLRLILDLKELVVKKNEY